MQNKPIDWSQLWYPGRKTPFTPAEMAAAGSDAPSRTLLAVSAVQFITMSAVALQIAPADHTARLTACLVFLAVVYYTTLRWLWWRPWRKPLAQAQVVSLTGFVVLAFLLRWRLPERSDREVYGITLAAAVSLLAVLQWFLVVWRATQIDSRLREQAEREKSIEMARRLAAAQLEPHFLFNTLASAQHWVQTKDDRAPALLAALTGYLRATLPLFNRPLLPLADELKAVEHYLQVMQLRMGARMRWQVAVPSDLHPVLLPPGVLLTLVENAVQHGLEPQIAGGEVRISARQQGALAVVEVLDDGRGPPADMADGVGLANVRQRLQLACGSAAQLDITPAEGGGCHARLQLPLETRS